MKLRVYEHKTQYYETDQMGIIHHANYLHWFEEARVDMMDQMGMGYAQRSRGLYARFSRSTASTRAWRGSGRRSRFWFI